MKDTSMFKKITIAALSAAATLSVPIIGVNGIQKSTKTIPDTNVKRGDIESFLAFVVKAERDARVEIIVRVPFNPNVNTPQGQTKTKCNYEFCGATLRNQSGLEKHMKLHENDYLVMCYACHTMVAHANLNQHNRTNAHKKNAAK